MNTTTPLPFIEQEYPHWSGTLHDHSQVLIRPIGKHDKEAERAFIEALSGVRRVQPC